QSPPWNKPPKPQVLLRVHGDKALHRLLVGGLSGIVATMAMTMAMRRMHRMLDREEAYPLPPREIIEELNPALHETKARATTLAAHFGFGALAGALYAL